MKIKTFRKLSAIEKTNFYKELKKIKDSKDPAAENMWADDWEQQKNTLPYKLEKTELFNNQGEFYIVYDNKKFVCCGGVYRSTFSEYVALAGTRTWISENYRNSHAAGYILLPAHKQWAIDNGYKQIALCFNEYNKNLIKIWKRKRLGEDRRPKTTDRIFSDNLYELDFPVNIQYTKQWVIYEKLDKDWQFDWSTIKFN